MNKFNFFLVLCMLIAISVQVLNACPPCADHRGEKRYCVKTDLLGLQTCVAASQKGGRCSSTQIKSGVYEGRPPCQEGLECSETMGGKCT